ncbi:hypothetical protein C0J52_24983 [Blattella germanica]|nr:hypothetical protein C0J52_24983 [Blattella germanica]
MWKILIILTIVVSVQSTDGSIFKRTSKTPAEISRTEPPTTTKEKPPTTTSAGITSRIWRSTDKHRHHHGIKSSVAHDALSSTTISPLKTIPKELKDVIRQSDEEAAKRTSRLITIEAEPENLKKSIEIELKSYTPPPYEPAVIEVLPESSNSYQSPLLNSWSYSYPQAVQAKQWPSLSYDPSQRNVYGQVNYNAYNNPYQYRIPFVPTEELIHGQSYGNNYDVNPFIYYSQAEPSLQPQVDLPRTVRYDPYVLKDIIIKKSSALPLKPESENEDSVTKVNTEVTSVSQVEANKQNNVPTQWVLYPEELAKSISINTGPALQNKPIVTKFVTRSYQLKTYPKLEWVPL